MFAMPAAYSGVSRGGYYRWKDRPLSKTALRRIWLAREIIDIHKQSYGTYGVPRVTAELRFGRGVPIGQNTVSSIMVELGLKGIPNRRPPKGAKMARITSLDLVRRNFHRPAPNQLWLTDITEHPTRRARSSAARSSTCSPAG
jgi:putative transposase